LEQRAYAGLVLGANPPELLVASATGASVARLLRQATEQVEAGTGRQILVVDVRPLSPKDPQGLVMFYAMLAATIAGFLLTFQLRANASGLTLRAWVGFALGGALLGGLTISVIAGPVLGALGDRVGVLWAIVSTQMAIAAVVNSTNLALFGGWAILPTWLLFVIVGNAASGGAVAPPLLPPVYAFIGRWLPSGATVEALRNVVYFPSAQQVQRYVVLAAWLLGALAALLLVTRAWGLRPMA
jgi:MFS family permease